MKNEQLEFDFDKPIGLFKTWIDDAVVDRIRPFVLNVEFSVYTDSNGFRRIRFTNEE